MGIPCISLKPFFHLFALMVFALLFTSCTSTKTIVNSLDEKEANEILVYLSSKGIDANKVKSGEAGGGGSKLVLWDIAVNAEQATEAMALLNQAGLPRRRGANLLGIFANVGLVPSDLEQKIRYEAGLAEQIASTIRKIDGVLDAEVQVSFPQEDPLNPGQYKGKITASVYVKHNGVLDDPNSHLISKIKRLVASSITGLSYDDVTIIPDRARYGEVQPGTIGLGGEEEKQFVSVWSMVIAKESLTMFRIIFVSLSALILLLLLMLVWIIWKIFPLLKQHGGFRELFHLHPIKVLPKAEEKPEEKEKAEGEEEAEEEKNVDIT
ncbi:MAG: type III secretion inner membrane ring lipoprotein SctJ [Parachlamydia sp.]|nr:type III secretion inner membrane ring lipoprotein SctJ [Parachlamydia sp.]